MNLRLHTRFRLYPICIVILLIILNNACVKDQGQRLPENDPAPQESDYSTTIKPLIISKCAISGCHITGFPFGNFTTYPDLKKMIDNGRIKTLVYENDLMPPANFPQLSNGELEALQRWIDNGAAEN